MRLVPVNKYKDNNHNDLNEWYLKYKSSTSSTEKECIKAKIFEIFLPLVKKISHGLARRSSDPVEDLIQVGSMGLLKAIDQFDINGGANFKTYASCLITGEIRHYLRDKVAMIKAPREIHELSFRINLIEEELTDKFKREPTGSEIALKLELPVKRVNEAYEANRRKLFISLDQVMATSSESESPLIEKLKDDKYQDYLLAQEDRMMINEAVEKLDLNLKIVVQLRYFDDLSQAEIAKKLGISQMQVSRRLKKALSDLHCIVSNKQTDSNYKESNDATY